MPQTERTNPKKRIMRAFKLDEISAVDRPAQEGARMAIMKRMNPQEVFERTMTKIDPQPRAAMKPAYDGVSESAKQVWLACVEMVRSRDGCSGVEALRRARKEYPGEFADFQTVAGHPAPYRDQLSKDQLMKIVAFPSFEAAVADIKKAEGCTGTQAMQRAADRYPVLLQKMRAEAIAAARASQEALEAVRKAKDKDCLETGPMPEDDEEDDEAKAKREAAKKFENCATEIARTEKCSGTEAYQKARQRYPELVAGMSN